MNKNEVELQKAAITSGTIARVINLMHKLLTLGAVVWSISIIMSGLEAIVGHKPDSLNALAMVIEKLNISGILSYVVAAGATAAWGLERKGKQRAYKQLGELRAKQEQGDPYHPSSALDNSGQSPKK